MFELSKEQINKILQKNKTNISVVSSCEPKITENGLYDFSHATFVNKCFCAKGAGKIQKGDRCVYCGNYNYYHIISKKRNLRMKELAEERESIIPYSLRYLASSKKTDSFWFVTKNPEENHGLIMIYFSILFNAIDTEELVDYTVKTEKIIYINSGKPSKAYKISRGKEVEMDLFDAFNINSKTVKSGVNIFWDGADGFLDYVLKNKDVFSRYGILECFNMSENNMSRNVFFMFYMYLYCEYPVIELLVKMKNHFLISNIVGELSIGYNKEYIRQKSKNMNKLLNNESTKGSNALRIPRYISDYLNDIEANVGKYLNWCDFYELENISKKEFNDLMENEIFLRIININYTGMEKILSVMRYGYKIKKLLSYIQKQGEENDYITLLELLSDYRNMMNIMEIEAEEFPGKLTSAHNNALASYRANQDKLNDKQLEEIADKVEKIKFDSEDYIVKIPRKVVDFITEGNQQHNCVSSYVKAVINKNCIIFFIRKKDSPEDSFITAEYRYGQLNQLMYKNNIRVNDAKLIKLAQDFCNKIKNAHII